MVCGGESIRNGVYVSVPARARKGRPSVDKSTQKLSGARVVAHNIYPLRYCWRPSRCLQHTPASRTTVCVSSGLLVLHGHSRWVTPTAFYSRSPHRTVSRVKRLTPRLNLLGVCCLARWARWNGSKALPPIKIYCTSLVSKRMPSGQALKMLLLTRGCTLSSSLSNKPRRRPVVSIVYNSHRGTHTVTTVGLTTRCPCLPKTRLAPRSRSRSAVSRRSAAGCCQLNDCRCSRDCQGAPYITIMLVSCCPRLLSATGRASCYLLHG